MGKIIFRGPHLLWSLFAKRERMNTSLVVTYLQHQLFEVQKLNVENNMVMSWLMDSMNNDVGEIFLFY